MNPTRQYDDEFASDELKDAREAEVMTLTCRIDVDHKVARLLKLNRDRTPQLKSPENGHYGLEGTMWLR